MSIVRALDSLGDWTFGAGFNDYKSGAVAVAQNISTRLNSFIVDCFFDQGAGLNWFGLLGSKDEISLHLAVSAVILNTADVVSITELFITLNSQRKVSIAYTVSTSFGSISSTTTAGL